MFISCIVRGSLLACLASALIRNAYDGWTAANIGDDVILSWSGTQCFKYNGSFLFLYVKLNNETMITSLTQNKTHVNVKQAVDHRIRYTGNISTKGGVFSLMLKNVQEADAGRYSCIDGKKLVPKCGQSLVVLQPPSTPNISISSNSTVPGHPVTLKCSSFSQSLPSDHPYNLSYTWRINGTDLQQEHGPKLTLHNVTRHDKVVCSCQAIEAIEDKEIRSNWSRQLYGPHQVQFDPDSDTVTVSEGRNVNVTCSADCNPPCNVTWLDNSGQTVSQSLQKAVINVTEEESEKLPYKCDVANSFGKKSRNVSIQIPSSIRNCTSNTGTEDGTINIECTVYGKPQPNVSFRGKSVIMKLNKPLPDNTYKYSFVIKYASCYDHGKYDVIASNDVGSPDSYQLYLKVKCSGSQPSNVIIPVAAVCSVLVLVLAVVAAVFIQRYKSKIGSEKYRVSEDVEGNPKSFGPSGDDVYATIRKTNRKKNKDLCSKVRKPRNTPQACTNKLYASAGPKSESQALINPDSAGELDGVLNNNCGEKNADGLTYADLDLPAPTMVNGQPVINSKEEPVVYEEIDFSQTPGPQLPEKIWEKEGSAP